MARIWGTIPDWKSSSTPFRLSFAALTIAAPSLLPAAMLPAQTTAWRGLSPPISARANSAMVYDSARGVSVLFGGPTGSGAVGDTWEWDGATWIGRAGNGPSARSRHA